ncbi:hypothetical protein R1CP_35780 (plasmid) [Rhodococcus opacus]|uniref:AAA+ ATPase domain-containing protein n=1 Tax=Rhodococcus opacus TaxID=37919 RepID=A0A1B1KGL4_RHOOP|nr:AAA family ATPase [Rhodococcus opacus]ANS31762.1 hypothetical protein R1CP_35780 [Rhodococcus opacus]
MRFVVLASGSEPKTKTKDTGYLYRTSWDDWFRFQTTFVLYYVDGVGEEHHIGSVKIGQFGMGVGSADDMPADTRSPFRSPRLPRTFRDLLSDEFFSVGQDADYYDNLNKLGSEIRHTTLASLNDLAYVDGLLERAMNERVTEKSLMRFVTRNTIEGQYRRMAHGGARLTRYRFTYFASSKERQLEKGLGFRVTPESKPPTNIHVLIGRNGVGKTHLLDRMSRALVGVESDTGDAGVVDFETEAADDTTDFSKVVSISFSAFDSLAPVKPRPGMDYVYVGLKRPPVKSEGKLKPVAPKSPAMLAREFGASVLSCLRGERLDRWRNALRHLEADPVFAEVGVADLAGDYGDEDEEAKKTRAQDLYRKLSSGHKIVLLTMTKLVEQVEETSLVLLDEPESHLHPPLLSAFIRALSDLLTDRNGVSVIATHSPVVLQEVPLECVWILHRVGSHTRAHRPTVETFGENVSILTHEVFGLEVTKSGFHQLLRDAVEEGGSYEEILDGFRTSLGGEARSILRGLVATRDQRNRR